MCRCIQYRQFLSTPSARRATGKLRCGTVPAKYFYPRPPRGGRRRQALRRLYQDHFYPRPPRGGRPSGFNTFLRAICISIHALREEGDLLPSVLLPGSHYFYPRPPRGGRLGHAAAHIVGSEISIHALREEGDRLWSTNAIRRVRFLSTPSARRATIMYHTG